MLGALQSFLVLPLRGAVGMMVTSLRVLTLFALRHHLTNEIFLILHSILNILKLPLDVIGYRLLRVDFAICLLDIFGHVNELFFLVLLQESAPGDLCFELE